MATKVKAAAYRLAGGSKTVYGADYEGKLSLFNNFKSQTEKLISLILNMVTVSTPNIHFSHRCISRFFAVFCKNSIAD